MRKLEPMTLAAVLLWLGAALVLAFYVVFMGQFTVGMKAMLAIGSLGCLGVAAVILKIDVIASLARSKSR
jgi:membrane protein YdbS with pleckstrin-like domain